MSWAQQRKGGPPRFQPGETLTGMVKSYNRKGFGFIMCQALDADVYFSKESIALALQTADIAGEYVTFEVFAFPDGKFQARNVRATGDTTQFTRGPDGFGGATLKGKGFGKSFSSGPAPTGSGREEEDRSRDWYCENCGERNFMKRLECFKCKAPRPPGAGEISEPVPMVRPRRTLSPHAGSRAMRDTLRQQLENKGGAANRSRSRSKNRRRSSSGGSESSKSSSSDDSSQRKKKKKKRRRSRSASSSSSSSDSVKASVDVEASSSAAQDKAPANPEVETAKAEVLQKMMKLQKIADRETRIRDWRALLREWHPDKNPDRTEVATAVFQFLQKAKSLIDTDPK